MKDLYLLLLLATAAYGFVDYGPVFPESYALGQAAVLHADDPYNEHGIHLSPDKPYLTLDYATEVAGFPFFDVKSLSAPTQIEVKYAEDFVALENIYSDGPWTFSNGLSNSFRTETFNLTAPGRVQSYFVQGGQRWETIRLLSNTTVTFKSLGFKSTAEHTATDKTVGQFSSSNHIYDQIWDLGARVVQVACIDAGNAPSTWEITDEGAFIRGQQTAQSAEGLALGNYTLSFSTKILRGGTGWRIASGTTPSGAVFYLTSRYPEETTYLNTNRTLLPPNTLVFNFGPSIVNQSTLQTGWNQYFSINSTIEENEWYNISTTITPEGYIIKIDDTSILVPIFEAAYLTSVSTSSFSSASPHTGTWGFGPWNGQEAYIKDVSVTLQNGTIAYSNPMTSESVLAEYAVAPLDASVCLDGAKRDRLVWIGDFYHTTKVIASSTHRMDYVLGSIEYAFSYQKQNSPYKGFVSIAADLGSRPEYRDAFGRYSGLLDYQDLFLGAIGDYFWRSGDLKNLEKHWENIKMLAEARIEYIDPYSGLVAGDPTAFYFLGPVNGSTVTAIFSYALQRLVPLAEVMNDTASAEYYRTTAQKLNDAVNRELWNPELGTYSLSLTAPSNYSLTSIAWTLLSGAANSTQASTMINHVLPTLRLGVGYKTSSDVVDSPTAQLSPNILGMLLEGLFIAQTTLDVTNTTVAQTLMDDYWSKMVTQDEYYSGAAWEYLYPDGSPGIDLFTSLAHPWGAAPTYVLPEYVLGIQATSPGFKTWEFRPNLGVLGLKEANGTVATPFGLIQAKWEIVDGGKGAIITAAGPKGTKGKLVLPEGGEAECENKKQRGGHIDMNGGRQTNVRVSGMKSV